MNKIDEWHKILQSEDLNGLKKLLDKNVTFYSPVVFKGQEGRQLTTLYLSSAYKMFFQNDNKSFTYIRELNSESDSILEFTCEVDGILVNGVDMIKWSPEGKIIEFKVMLRPYKAIELVKSKMVDLLNSISTMDKIKLKAASVLDKLS